MKILFINLFYAPNMIGGTEHSLNMLAEGLERKGHSVVVVTYDGKSKGITEDSINNIHIYRMGIPVFLRRAYHETITRKELIKYYLGKYFGVTIYKYLRAIITKEKPDVIHTQNFFPTNLYKLFKKKQIVTVHTIRDYYFLDPKSNINTSNLLVAFLHRLYQKHYTSCYLDCVTATSFYALNKHTLKGFFTNSIQTVIPNAIEYNREELLEIECEKRKRTRKEIFFLFVGALNKEKGINILINAFKRIRNNNIRLVICGRGPLEKTIIQSTKEDKRILYRGQLDTPELACERVKSDVSIVPSVWPEPFGRVVIEASKYMLPVIAARSGGIEEIMNKLQCGQTYLPTDENELLRLINYFSDRRNIQLYYKNIIDNIDYYSASSQLDKFERLYCDLFGRRDE